MKLLKKLETFWWFTFRNPVVRKGEAGGFKWVFRNLTLDVTTLSGNWKARWTADAHPYGYLMAGESDENIHGYCQIMYTVGKLLTTDQGFADDIAKAIKKYNARLEKAAAKEVVEDETEEKIALEEMKQVREVVEMPKKERKRHAKDADKRFKKAVKEMEVARNLQEGKEKE